MAFAEPDGINKGVRSQKKILKELFIHKIENEIADVISFDNRIKPFFDKIRVKIKRINPVPIQNRKKVEANLFDDCFICIGSSRPYIVNPAFIYKIEKHSYGTKYSLMYFTNFESCFLITNKLEINGYGFLSVYGDEFGLTPEEAVENKY